MRFQVITLFPEGFRPLVGLGVTGRAISDGRVQLELLNPRDFAQDRHRTVDDRPYGGGPGMVMAVEPLRSTIRSARERAGCKVQVSLLSPQGRRLDQDAVKEMAIRPGLVLLAGRYEGIDERLIEAYVDEQWSIGDYVVSGGELTAMVLMDAVIRQLPGVLGHADSAKQDSYADGLLDCPHYTRPEEIDGRRVPAVLLSGDHARIAAWRGRQALGRTHLRRPDLVERMDLSDEQRRMLDDFLQERRGEN